MRGNGLLVRSAVVRHARAWRRTARLL